MREVMEEIASSGVSAPSADNQHIFRIEFGDAYLRLWPTEEFMANVARHRRILGLVSLGAVVENMRIRAEALGYSAQVKLFLDQSVGSPLAQLNLSYVGTVGSNELAVAIPDRCTNRKMYRGPLLSTAETASLDSVASQADEVQLTWLTGIARKRALTLIWRAESERFLRQDLHREIFSSIRFDQGWSKGSEYSLPPGALEIELPMRPFFQAIKHWPLMRVLNLLGMHKLVGLRAGWLPCWYASNLAVLTASGDLENGAVSVGSVFERLWLKATSMGLALQPLAASVVLPLQEDEGGAGVSRHLREQLIEGWEAIVPGARPLMLFRVGRADKPQIRAGRHQLAYYVRQP